MSIFDHLSFSERVKIRTRVELGLYIPYIFSQILQTPPSKSDLVLVKFGRLGSKKDFFLIDSLQEKD